ncbi:cytochrome c oxidase subunit 8A, mitochondrial-like [Melanotaenia boesemani]|uniref:cytochrome c oxidase subunit 8A, mitochondrial-like n=1 Tax=Melanotaenia boesemani TaxID=1250792 RepID=UPI001C0469F9|nr:cytochrome c oxidase subunit 8A, mitochondrial-like [Melanotaenia boesemani]
MSFIFKRPSLTRLLKTQQQNQRSTICSKPPKEKIGPVQSVFALCVFAVTLLAPAGWILRHIPDYRQRSPPHP